MNWPVAFQNFFQWLEFFSLDFGVFGGAQLGLWSTIWTGLLVPLWLIQMFDAGKRENCGATSYQGSHIPAFPLQLTLFHSPACNEALSEGWRKKYGDPLCTRQDNPKRYFRITSIASGIFITFAISGAATQWYKSDILDALFLVLSVLFALKYFVYQYYLSKAKKSCEDALEDFGRTRQKFEMYLFVLMYPIFYLSGVSACAEMAKVSDKTTAFVGYVLLPIYIFAPPLYLGKIGRRVKDSLGDDGDVDYKARLAEVQKEAHEDILDMKHAEKDERERKSEELGFNAPGVKAAVVGGLLGSFKEKVRGAS